MTNPRKVWNLAIPCMDEDCCPSLCHPHRFITSNTMCPQPTSPSYREKVSKFIPTYPFCSMQPDLSWNMTENLICGQVKKHSKRAMFTDEINILFLVFLKILMQYEAHTIACCITHFSSYFCEWKISLFFNCHYCSLPISHMPYPGDRKLPDQVLSREDSINFCNIFLKITLRCSQICRMLLW